jgi:chromosome segregation ATPase
MIAEAAYYRAERRGFIIGDTAQDWLDAEAEIDRILQHQMSHGETPQGTEKQVFQQKLEAQLKDWDAKLDELKAKTNEAKTELRADYEKQLEILSDKRATAQAKLQELRLRTEDAWEDLKGGTERAWDEMRKALDQIASRFK